jgi:pimeloyl-ACP methyl ester carboxylesterase
VYDVGQLNGQWYIATEHIDGRPLRAHMGAPLPLETALEFAAQIASALDVAHSAGIVHRDLKPENVMVRSDGILKLLDFGLAKPLRESPSDLDGTDPGMVMGTANYMSPEQARGWPVDARTDVFSLGALLYEMLTGAAPFAAPTNSDVIAALLTREPRPLHDIHADLAAAQPLIDLALAKDREQRWPSAKSLLQAIQALRGDRHLQRPRAAAPAVRFEAHLQIPEVRYARSGEVNIAYQVIGQAPLDLVFVMGWITHLEYFWTEPSFAQFLRRLATFARVILFDKRGTGLSDRVPLDQLPTLEQRMDDVRAVMEAAGSERAVLCGVSEGGPMCSLFAATYPERTVALVMIGSYARRLRTKDYPWGPSAAERDAFLDQIREHWGQPVGIEERAASVASDPAFRSWWAAYLRRGASPAAAVALTRMNTEIDVRPILPSIRVPTLIVHRSGDRCLQVGEGRYLAEHIPGAKFVELPGIDHLPFVGAQDEILDEIEEFLTGVRHASGFDRVLATVLCAQSVDPSALRAHELLLRKEIELFKGKPMRSDGDVLASFDGPARAVRAACALRAAASRLKIDLRVGVHTGECDVEGERLSGLAVDIAAAVAQRATRGVLVSGTVKDLVAGAGIQFDDGNTAELPAPLGAWRLYNVRG